MQFNRERAIGTAPDQHRPSVPTGGESPFGIDEIFFSTTDRKGIIRTCNDVFERVSGYTREEMVGRPHNLVRHPDTPRAVFRLLWQEIEAGRPVAAYIKNRAKDGRYYWVMATVAPYDGGYLSVRVKPSSDCFATAQVIYQELVALEQSIEGADPRRRQQAISASGARLSELLAAAGYPDYEAFMRAALLAEVTNRDRAIGTVARRGLSVVRPDAEPALSEILSTCGRVCAFLDGLVARLDDLSALYDKLAGQARFVLDLADDVQLYSLNAQLATPRLGSEGITLAAVAEIMRARSGTSDPVFQALAADVSTAGDVLGGMFFPVAATKLQAEVVITFVRELIARDGGARATAADLGALACCLIDGVTRLAASLEALDAGMRSLNQHIAHLQAELKVMRTLELNGRIEAARTTGADALITLFQTIAERIRSARRELEELADTGRISFAEDAAAARRSREHAETIRFQAAALAAA